MLFDSFPLDIQVCKFQVSFKYKVYQQNWFLIQIQGVSTIWNYFGKNSVLYNFIRLLTTCIKEKYCSKTGGGGLSRDTLTLTRPPSPIWHLGGHNLSYPTTPPPKSVTYDWNSPSRILFERILYSRRKCDFYAQNRHKLVQFNDTTCIFLTLYLSQCLLFQSLEPIL